MSGPPTFLWLPAFLLLGSIVLGQEPAASKELSSGEVDLLSDPANWPEETPPLPSPSLSVGEEDTSGTSLPTEPAPDPLPPFHLESVFITAVDPGVATRSLSLKDVVRMALGQPPESGNAALADVEGPGEAVFY